VEACKWRGGWAGTRQGGDLQAHVQAGVQRRREALPADAARQLGKVYPLRSPRAVSQADGCWQAGAHRQAGAEKRSGCAQRDAPSGSKAEFHGPGVRVARLKKQDCCGRNCGRKSAPPRKQPGCCGRNCGCQSAPQRKPPVRGGRRECLDLDGAAEVGYLGLERLQIERELRRPTCQAPPPTAIPDSQHSPGPVS
jgi:hypothetical protein